MSDKAVKRNQGPFVGGLTLLFIGLKLTDHIAWPWWQVLSPTGIFMALVFFEWALRKIISRGGGET